MARNEKTIIGMYSAWNYEGEIERLNALSQKGWQLVRGGSFSSRFVKNEAVRYLYQLDYQPKIEDKGHYLETFREQGWEFVSETFNGWYYFRKLYDPSLPEEAYEIYTDRDSLHAMHKRWTNTALFCAVTVGVLLIVIGSFHLACPRLPSTVLLIAVLVEFFTLLRGYLIMRNPDRAKRDTLDRLRLSIMFGALVIGIPLFFALTLTRPDPVTHMAAEEYGPVAAELENAVEIGTFRIRYSDNYYLDLEVQAARDLTFSILAPDKSAVFIQRLQSGELSDEKLRLAPGEYTVVLSDFSGGAIDLKYELN